MKNWDSAFGDIGAGSFFVGMRNSPLLISPMLSSSLFYCKGLQYYY